MKQQQKKTTYMNIKRLFLSLIAIAFYAVAMAGDSICHITGTIDDPRAKEVELGTESFNFKYENSIHIPVKDGKFSYDLRFSVSEPRYYIVVPDYQLEEGVFTPARFIAEPSHVKMHFFKEGKRSPHPTVEGDGQEMQSVALMKHAVSDKWRPVFDRLDIQSDSLLHIMYAGYKRLPESQQEAYADSFYEGKSELGKVWQKFEAGYKDSITNYYIAQAKYMEAHPGFYALAWLWYNFVDGSDFAPNQIEAYQNLYYNALCNIMPGHRYHSDIQHKFESEMLRPGAKYIDYDVRGPEGNTVKLSSLYKGKIIYIDLWMTWCGGCRRHLQEYIPLYEKYKDKGFQVIGIVGGSDMGVMRHAVEHDGYPWTTLYELNDEHHLWIINGISNAGGGGYLIKSDGTILAKYPDAEETEKILKKELAE